MSAFQKIGSDHALQDHWIRRIIAAIIDYIIIAVASAIISAFILLPTLLLGVPFFLGAFPLLGGILFFLYASFMEAYQGATLGKMFMNLKVTTMDGRAATIDKTLIRNISKIYPLLWLIDTIIGMAVVGDPHQKYSDRFARTTVVSTTATGMILPSAAPPPPPPPAP